MLINSIDEVLIAVNNKFNDFSTNLKQRNCLSRLFYRIFHSYHPEINQIALATAELYKGKFKDLIEKSHNAKNKVENEFFQKLIQIAKKNIENRKQCSGIIYEVVNSAGIKNYVIGTIHIANRYMFNEKMGNIIENSFEVITEVGNDRTVIIVHKIKNVFKKMKYHIDFAITKMAMLRKKRITALTTRQELSKAKLKGIRAKKLSDDVEISEKNYNRLLKHKKYLIYEAIEAWQNGDDKELELIGCDLTHPAERKKILDDLNSRWINNGLAKKFDQTRYPICLAVGASHLYGEKGLIEAFRSQGLQFQKISH